MAPNAQERGPKNKNQGREIPWGEGRGEGVGGKCKKYSTRPKAKTATPSTETPLGHPKYCTVQRNPSTMKGRKIVATKKVKGG